VGFEADIQVAVEKDGSTLTDPFSFTFATFPVTGAAVTDSQAKINWFGTVRGRIGYVWRNGAVMSYVTGGWPMAR